MGAAVQTPVCLWQPLELPPNDPKQEPSPSARADALPVVRAGIDLGQDACVPALQRRFAGASISLLVCNAGLLRADSLDALDFGAIREQVLGLGGEGRLG